MPGCERPSERRYPIAQRGCGVRHPERAVRADRPGPYRASAVRGLPQFFGITLIQTEEEIVPDSAIPDAVPQAVQAEAKAADLDLYVGIEAEDDDGSRSDGWPSGDRCTTARRMPSSTAARMSRDTTWSLVAGSRCPRSGRERTPPSRAPCGRVPCYAVHCVNSMTRKFGRFSAVSENYLIPNRPARPNRSRANNSWIFRICVGIRLASVDGVGCHATPSTDARPTRKASPNPLLRASRSFL